MLLGVVADDFTGASDIANTLARGLPGEGGLRTAQFLGVPRIRVAKRYRGRSYRSQKPLDPSRGCCGAVAGGAALASGRKAHVNLSSNTARPSISTPSGNIGPVGEALADALAVKGVVACPAFPTMGRTVYQGHLFVGDRPLNEFRARTIRSIR